MGVNLFSDILYFPVYQRDLELLNSAEYFFFYNSRSLDSR